MANRAINIVRESESTEAVPEFCIIVVDATGRLGQAARAALGALADGGLIALSGDVAANLDAAASSTFDTVFERAQRFLEAQKWRARCMLISADSEAQLLARLQRQPPAGPIGLCIANADDLSSRAAKAERLEALYDALASAGIECRRTNDSDLLFSEHDASGAEAGGAPELGGVPVRLLTESGELATQVLFGLLDYIDNGFASAFMRKMARRGTPQVTLARSLVGAFRARYGERFAYYYYTGSAVCSFIATIEHELAGSAVLGYRGASEHALACMAIANWQTQRLPYLIVVTSGMMDEFRGTLANLVATESEGVIVCAENGREQWFAFQGTLSASDDMCATLKARNVPSVYLDDPAAIPATLDQTGRWLSQSRGPMAILATQRVLEFTGELDETSSVTRAVAPVSAPAEGNRSIDEALELINQRRARILWRCGALTPEERALVLEIAERAGIALADTLTRPGSVSRYAEGRVVPGYLGTLGLYGTSRGVHEFLFEDGRLRDKASQSVFFLKSKLGQFAAPVTAVQLGRQLHAVQLSHRPEHLAKSAALKLCMPLLDFLERVRARLEPDPDVVQYRRQAIEQARRAERGFVELGARTDPPTLSRFVAQLAELVGDLIVDDGYRYTGVFDVGHGGMSAARRLPRTQPGFSGWYGRALMGDALQAVPALTLSQADNLIAVVGDGAEALVPNILPILAEQAARYPAAFAKNVSVFVLRNRVLGLIEGYQRGMLGQRPGRQIPVPCLPQPELAFEVGNVVFARQPLARFDAELLSARLTRRNAVNVFDVRVIENHDEDTGLPRMPGSWRG
jgi:thiamine pyrophosphate-dependent acetolactate synthase large subunit-like protein